MNILFLTLVNIENINERHIYTDLLRKFRDEGHNVYIVSPAERRFKQKTNLQLLYGINLLKIKTLNTQKTNLLEKGISTLLIEHQYLAGIKKYISEVKFDLILYSTPPITFAKVIQYIKLRDGALSYLLLKDIFPQNAVDLGMIKKNGFIHKYFRHKEKNLYQISDYIGCMSPANVEYVIKHNPKINPKIIEVNPNSIELNFSSISKEEIIEIRKRYNIPLEATAFIYGGNLGKPQGINFLLDILNLIKENDSIFFIIIGSGTEFSKVQTWFNRYNPKNSILLNNLPKNDYDQLVQSCDVGMIFLDKRFTIPNFPSRLLSYLSYKMPVIAATDPNTDLGKIMEANNFGFWAQSGDSIKMKELIEQIAKSSVIRDKMGEKGFKFLIENYSVIHSYQIIMNHFNN